MPSNGKISFSYGAESVEISQPDFGYQTTINLPFEIAELNNGALSIYDPDSSGTEVYDIRQCTAKFFLTATELNNLNAFFTDAAKGRGRDVTMTLNTGSGFFPFGPDKGDAGAFTVSVIMGKHASQSNAPWKYFEKDFVITNTGSYPAYSLPAEVSEGSFTIGTISNNRFPLNWFEVDGEYGVVTVLDQGSDSHYTDRGSGGDFWRTGFNMISNQSKAAATINYLVKTARAQGFNIIADSDFYAFGRAKGSNGTYSVRMIQDSIEITHSRFNEFQYSLNLEYIATL